MLFFDPHQISSSKERRELARDLRSSPHQLVFAFAFTAVLGFLTLWLGDVVTSSWTIAAASTNVLSFCLILCLFLYTIYFYELVATVFVYFDDPISGRAVSYLLLLSIGLLMRVLRIYPFYWPFLFLIPCFFVLCKLYIFQKLCDKELEGDLLSMIGRWKAWTVGVSLGLCVVGGLLAPSPQEPSRQWISAGATLFILASGLYGVVFAFAEIRKNVEGLVESRLARFREPQQGTEVCTLENDR